MTTIEALDLAIETVREAVESYQLDHRAVTMLGVDAPKDVRRRAKKRQRLLEAIGPLTKLKQQEMQHEKN